MILLRLLLLLVATLPSAAAEAAPPRKAPVVILVSIDGFRPDYLDRGVTPNLSRLAAGGVRAAMRPSFPSKTFPNHFAIVTGLRPDRNGIVANKMEDARKPGQLFTMDTEDPFWWNAAVPVWVAAEKAGIRTATMFWPGASVDFGGVRPEDWWPYGKAVSNRQRVEGIIDWLRRPAATRPRFLTLYFDTVDTAGHDFGPYDARTTKAVAEVDTAIGALLAGLRGLGQSANLVIVSDHGMAATSSSSRAVLARDLADPADYRLIESGVYASFQPVPGHEAALAKALLRPHDHLSCWRREDIPARFHYGRNPRVPPFLCLAEVGWQILKEPPKEPKEGGEHGYDNAAPDMAALFIASGPAFPRGTRLPAFDNVDVEPLLRDLLKLPQQAGIDGSDTPFRGVLKR
jgi:predicted AlkP superfamily pyrophosphatase or phosphodiesterase